MFPCHDLLFGTSEVRFSFYESGSHPYSLQIGLNFSTFLWRVQWSDAFSIHDRILWHMIKTSFTSLPQHDFLPTSVQVFRCLSNIIKAIFLVCSKIRLLCNWQVLPNACRSEHSFSFLPGVRISKQLQGSLEGIVVVGNSWGRLPKLDLLLLPFLSLFKTDCSNLIFTSYTISCILLIL